MDKTDISINELPDEVLLRLTENADAKTLINLCSTNTNFREFCKHFKLDIYGKNILRKFPGFDLNSVLLKNLDQAYLQLEEGIKNYIENGREFGIYEKDIIWYPDNDDILINVDDHLQSYHDVPLSKVSRLFTPLTSNKSKEIRITFYNFDQIDLPVAVYLIKLDRPVSLIDIFHTIRSSNTETIYENTRQEVEILVKKFNNILEDDLLPRGINYRTGNTDDIYEMYIEAGNYPAIDEPTQLLTDIGINNFLRFRFSLYLEDNSLYTFLKDDNIPTFELEYDYINL